MLFCKESNVTQNEMTSLVFLCYPVDVHTTIITRCCKKYSRTISNVKNWLRLALLNVTSMTKTPTLARKKIKLLVKYGNRNELCTVKHFALWRCVIAATNKTKQFNDCSRWPTTTQCHGSTSHVNIRRRRHHLSNQSHLKIHRHTTVTLHYAHSMSNITFITTCLQSYSDTVSNNAVFHVIWNLIWVQSINCKFI